MQYNSSVLGSKQTIQPISSTVPYANPVFSTSTFLASNSTQDDSSYETDVDNRTQYSSGDDVIPSSRIEDNARNNLSVIRSIQTVQPMSSTVPNVNPIFSTSTSLASNSNQNDRLPSYTDYLQNSSGNDVLPSYTESLRQNTVSHPDLVSILM